MINLTLKPGATVVEGGIIAEGDISLEPNAAIASDICAGGSVALASGASITGNVHVAGDVTLGNNATIVGNVYCGGTVSGESGITGSINPYDSCPFSTTAPPGLILSWEVQ